MTKLTEDKPAIVPRAQQAGTAHVLWVWAKPCVWTIRMLTALLARVEGMKWFRLFDKVFSEQNLLASFQKVAQKKGAGGVDHVTVDEFERRLPDSVWELSDQLKTGTYRPQAVRRVNIPKPGSNETRPLGIPTVRDRTVQAAVVNVIEPIFERDFAEHSYGFRPGRGCKDALRRVDQLIQQKSLKKLKDVIRQKTRRNSGDSMEFIVNNLNQTLRGWFAYFQHIRPPWVFRNLDGWLRMRLRSILRYRIGGRGRGRGLDHNKWPNRYFAKLGLFSLVDARAKVVQSSLR